MRLPLEEIETIEIAVAEAVSASAVVREAWVDRAGSLEQAILCRAEALLALILTMGLWVPGRQETQMLCLQVGQRQQGVVVVARVAKVAERVGRRGPVAVVLVRAALQNSLALGI